MKWLDSQREIEIRQGAPATAGGDIVNNAEQDDAGPQPDDEQRIVGAGITATEGHDEEEALRLGLGIRRGSGSSSSGRRGVF
ncbi:MAG: hypothetical protein GY772_19715 [bacterium]|nr:hypothetical protein [bacterium]